ncbi:DUF742 domain-containing protein [Nonomuraea sp. KC401]|uniref:DUF742 domain-containing protein n=2 Tax=Nonomuraea TaxID=83681 RepID=A0A4R4N098_9ACTN|nr:MULTISPECIES: DUF742 domain-containing protein [Nonomuraea]NBE98688.1 DUF742 domain-containing protein [Nonomuraea sp. K271]TDC01955.1 DUF742 domain-containing protein [Nonomuraea longispora]TDE58563.1 DUF742 domain-containing protein [Nonomuraea mesophila]TLF60071.1 DUF742 domain-containing protein [Nonomuraea sp. KC401]
MSREHEWVDEEAGPVVRPYAVTRGRTKPTSSSALDLLATVVSTGLPAPAKAELSSQHRRLLTFVTGKAKPLAEVASDLSLPVAVVRVLLGDLLDHGLVTVRPPRDKAVAPSESLLREVINGLRAL